MEHNNLDIFELIRIMAANRILIIVITMVVAIAAVTYSLLTPELFSSKASFFAVGDEISQLPINIPGLSGLASSFLGGDNAQKAENFITVMQSRTFSEDVIRQFGLIDYFELDHADSLRNLDDALLLLRTKVLSLDYDSGSGLITARARTKDKQLSLEIVNHILLRLDEYNREQKLTQGKLNRVFLESRVNEVRGKLDSLIVANQKFQETSKAIHLESQAKAMVESYSALIAESMKADIDLEMARANYGAQSPLVKEAELRKSSIRRQISELEKSGETPEYMINIGNLPKVTSDYLRIEMDMQIYKTLFEYLYPQYEAARLSELRDMPTIEVLDTPRLAGRRDYPKRALICVAATLAGFIFAVLLALILEIYRRNPSRIAEIKTSLKK
jgi:capsule polysaccharide export protein KpsE/RkpR